jgi:hypothetical protein
MKKAIYIMAAAILVLYAGAVVVILNNLYG